MPIVAPNFHFSSPSTQATALAAHSQHLILTSPLHRKAVVALVVALPHFYCCCWRQLFVTCSNNKPHMSQSHCGCRWLHGNSHCQHRCQVKPMEFPLTLTLYRCASYLLPGSAMPLLLPSATLLLWSRCCCRRRLQKWCCLGESLSPLPSLHPWLTVALFLLFIVAAWLSSTILSLLLSLSLLNSLLLLRCYCCCCCC